MDNNLTLYDEENNHIPVFWAYNTNTAKYVLIVFKTLALLEAEGKQPEKYISAEHFKYIYDNFLNVKESINDLMDN